MDIAKLTCLWSISVFCSVSKTYGQENLYDDEETAKRGEQEAALLTNLIMGHPGADYFNPCPAHSTGLAGEAFSDLINTMVISSCILGAPCTYPPDMGGTCEGKTIFDFIVVGGGTAGSVVASRLSEIADWNILLLEAGGNPPMTTDVPYFFINLQKTDNDWGYQTIRESGLFNGFMGKSDRWPRGKMLGGTSSMGSMLYIRGCRRDFDNIAAAGNVGWSYDDVLPYYLKSEDMRYNGIISSPILAAYHHRGGPLTISRFGGKLAIVDLLQSAANEIGYSINVDINGETNAGFAAPHSGTVRNGERMNTAKAFLNPVKHRKNLFVIVHARVTKIHICPQTKRAYGVEYYYRNEGVSRTLRASREIIICTGTIESPKLLMLSGIGPKNDLDELRIYVMKNLRVGRNLQDTVTLPIIPISLRFENDTKTALDYLDHSYEYLTRRTGLFATVGITELVGMLNTGNDDVPDIQVQFFYATINESSIIKEFAFTKSFEEDFVLQLLNVIAYSDMIIPQLMYLRPHSKGTIKLKSKNPDDPALIQAGYLEDPRDFEDLLLGIHFIERLAKQEHMRHYNANIEYMNFPGCCGLHPGTDYYWACVLSHIASTGHNQVGTCKMGPCEDPDAVVDPQLRIHGIKGLRVADASILPNTITGSIMATVIMIGEKAADMIKQQWLPDFKPTFSTRSPYRETTKTTVSSDKKFRHPYQVTPPPYILMTKSPHDKLVAGD